MEPESFQAKSAFLGSGHRVLIVGPRASGKTTTAIEIFKLLEKFGPTTIFDGAKPPPFADPYQSTIVTSDSYDGAKLTSYEFIVATLPTHEMHRWVMDDWPIKGPWTKIVMKTREMKTFIWD